MEKANIKGVTLSSGDVRKGSPGPNCVVKEGYITSGKVNRSFLNEEGDEEGRGSITTWSDNIMRKF